MNLILIELVEVNYKFNFKIFSLLYVCAVYARQVDVVTTNLMLLLKDAHFVGLAQVFGMLTSGPEFKPHDTRVCEFHVYSFLTLTKTKTDAHLAHLF